jgi:hypothetical protein
MRTPLGACPVCARHVRVSEHTCPFCRTELLSSFRDATPPPSPRVRLSRAALYALRVGTLSTTTVACGSGQTGDAYREASADGSEPSADGSEDSQEDSPFLMGVAYGLAITFQLCDSSADCPQGDTCGPEATDPSLPMTVCNACTSSSSCQPGQVCCAASGFMARTCQTGPCPDVAGLGSIQYCAISAECITMGDTCGPATQSGPSPNLTFCSAPSADGGTTDGGGDATTSDALAGD